MNAQQALGTFLEWLEINSEVSPSIDNIGTRGLDHYVAVELKYTEHADSLLAWSRFMRRFKVETYRGEYTTQVYVTGVIKKVKVHVFLAFFDEPIRELIASSTESDITLLKKLAEVSHG